MDKWLDCVVFPGQFTGEFAVRAKMFDATEFSLFAPKEDVRCSSEPSRDKSVKGSIRVVVGEQTNSLVLVKLPRPAFGCGQVITVKTSQIR